MQPPVDQELLDRESLARNAEEDSSALPAPRGDFRPLAEQDRARLAQYWWQRAEGERTSWLAFQQVRRDMSALGAPEEVLRLADRAIDDEYRHSLFCVDWAHRFGHPEETLAPRSEEPLRFRGASEELQALLRAAFCCLTETTGCFVLLGARSVIIDPELRALTRRHLADEMQHGRVGWGFLGSLDPARKRAVRRHLPLLLQGLLEANDWGAEEDWNHLVPYGYFSAGLLQEATHRALQEAIRPGLTELGIA